MANILVGRNWKIDTASATVIWTGDIFIKYVEVVGGVAGVVGGNMALIQDGAGNPIVTSLYQTANAGELQTFNIADVYHGLIIPTLGAGVNVLIHLS